MGLVPRAARRLVVAEHGLVRFVGGDHAGFFGLERAAEQLEEEGRAPHVASDSGQMTSYPEHS
jgi:hypothetical protein